MLAVASFGAPVPLSSCCRLRNFRAVLRQDVEGHDSYDPTRDEAPAQPLPENLWSGLVPWSFADAKTVSEHLFSYGHILHHANLPPKGSLLEYGPGTGQVLIMLSRMGYRACGVDIDAQALQGIRA